jgi:hypothetical protein
MPAGKAKARILFTEKTKAAGEVQLPNGQSLSTVRGNGG